MNPNRVAPRLVHDLLAHSARRTPDAPALLHRDTTLSHGELRDAVNGLVDTLRSAGIGRGERVAIYLPKRPEAVVAMLAAGAIGAAFIPVNPLLKAAQVQHILADSGASAIVTSSDRWQQLAQHATTPSALVLVDSTEGVDGALPLPAPVAGEPASGPWATVPDTDLAAILYTSGSTGNPKGVVLSHQNIVLGAESVASYLGNTADDRLLAALPLSFDYGMSQVTTALLRGAAVVLLDYLLPRDVLKALARYRITGLAAVPPLWMQLAELEWPEGVADQLRYITNSGGAMPPELTRRLREHLPSTQVFLMYGLTEAFRSTFLDPALVDAHPESMGRAIPNAEVLVVRPDGTPCDDDEPGELVHRGPLVAQGYWNDPQRTAERFREDPLHPAGTPLARPAVWSGDIVRRDSAGLLYFVSRKDEMIKTSGYRVSPTEVEDAVFQVAGVAECACTGVPDPQLGQAIVVFATVHGDAAPDADAIIAACRQALPTFMVPRTVQVLDSLPRNQNGKIDRRRLREDFLADAPVNKDP